MIKGIKGDAYADQLVIQSLADMLGKKIVIYDTIKMVDDEAKIITHTPRKGRKNTKLIGHLKRLLHE